MQPKRVQAWERGYNSYAYRNHATTKTAPVEFGNCLKQGKIATFIRHEIINVLQTHDHKAKIKGQHFGSGAYMCQEVVLCSTHKFLFDFTTVFNGTSLSLLMMSYICTMNLMCTLLCLVGSSVPMVTDYTIHKHKNNNEH